MLETSFPPWPSFSQEEIAAVTNVLDSNRVNQWTGNEVLAFEKEFADYVGSEHAIALANGTLALDLALIALNIREGDEVIVTPRSFIASVSSIVTIGAIPVFADVDPNTQNLCLDSIEKAITDKTKAIVIVHLAGMPTNMDRLMDIARDNNLRVIEDCAQAHGAKWNGRSVGTFGDIGAWSFCQDKIMSTGGEGGMVTTNNSDLWEKIWSYKDHGKSFTAVFEKDHSPGFRWLHESFGTNARMMEIQAAIGRIQITKMPGWHKKRLSFAEQIWTACRKYDWLRAPIVDSRAEHAAYKCYVFLNLEKLPHNWDRDRVIQRIAEHDIPIYQGSCGEVYLEKAFDGTNWRPLNRLPIAKMLSETSLMFLVHPTLEQAHIDLTIQAIDSVAKEITKSSKGQKPLVTM